ncbi:MAG TPA: BrnT family toxin [Methylocystis sp.]|nr:BrnT family toxin [Methylocystis sp.]
MVSSRLGRAGRPPSAQPEAPARTTDEPRRLAVGMLAGKHWTVVFTRRGETIELVSARQARDEEITVYESTKL